MLKPYKIHGTKRSIFRSFSSLVLRALTGGGVYGHTDEIIVLLENHIYIVWQSISIEANRV